MRVTLIGVVTAVTIALAAILVAAIVAFFTFPLFVDIRENPRYWDEIQRREKMGMTREEAAKSISDELRAEQDAQ